MKIHCVEPLSTKREGKAVSANLSEIMAMNQFLEFLNSKI